MAAVGHKGRKLHNKIGRRKKAKESEFSYSLCSNVNPTVSHVYQRGSEENSGRQLNIEIKI